MGEAIVVGGASGLVAVTEDLEEAAEILAAAAHAVTKADGAVALAQAELADARVACPSLAALTYAAAEAAADARWGPGGTRAVEAELGEVAATLRSAAKAYVHAERRALERLADVGGAVRGSVDAPLRLLRGTGLYDHVRLALMALVAVAEAVLREERLVNVSTRRIPGAQPIRTLAHIGELLTALSATRPREVVVDRVRGAGGEVSWIVTIPGTADGVSANGEVFDARSAIDLVDGGLSDAVAMVLATMERAGVEPGQPVLLAGHSQGGMVANAIAAAKTPFHVTTVLTVGAPSGAAPHRADVHYLHVENAADLVPGLDGADNPRTPAVVTATVDSRASEDPDVATASRSVAGAHGAAAYAWGLELLDGDTSESVRVWREHAQPFFDGVQTKRTAVAQVHGPPGPGVSASWSPGARP